MRIWIVGRYGMLAAALAKKCKARNLVYQTTSKGEVDIRDREQVESFMKRFAPTHILNAAAYTKVDFAENEREEAFAVNVLGAENLAKACKSCKAKLIHFSTDYVFSGKRLVPYREEDIPEPINYYGKTKLGGEQAVWKYTDNGLIIRTSWLFSSGGSNFVLTMKNLMNQHEKLSVVSDQLGRPTSVDDLAKASLSLLDQQGLFHYANRGEATWYDLSREILRQLSEKDDVRCQEITPILSSDYETLAVRPKFSVLSTDKVEKYVKIRTWKEALMDVI